jgi:hypothetical protein
MLMIPALLVLGISASPWFRKPWCWLAAIGSVVLILYFPVQQGYLFPMGQALLVLGISASAWFGEPNRWLTVLGAVLLLLAVPVTLFLGFLDVAFSCFDSCPDGPTHLGTGFWLPWMGFLLGGIGLIVVRRSAHRHTQKKAQAT